MLPRLENVLLRLGQAGFDLKSQKSKVVSGKLGHLNSKISDCAEASDKLQEHSVSMMTFFWDSKDWINWNFTLF